MKKRCVITGETPEGKSVVVSDTEIEGVSHRPGGMLHRLWGSDEAPTLPNDGSFRGSDQLFPPPGGYRMTLLTMAPQTEAERLAAAPPPELATNAAKLGVSDLYEPNRPGFHATDTIDLCYIVSGECYLELDDGKEVHLKAGDSIVQNGTKHAWWNRSDEPCVMVAACIGAAHKS